MANPHRPMPGQGVLFYRLPEQRYSPKAPQFKGFLILKHDYKKGEKVKIGAWMHKTSVGTDLIALGEDDFTKARDEAYLAEVAERNAPREVIPEYARRGAAVRARTVDDDDDEDIPL